MQKEKTHRLQFDVTPESKREYEEWRARGGFSSMAQFFACALTLLCWALEEVAEGRAIGSYDQKNKDFYNFVMPQFREVQNKAKYRTEVNELADKGELAEVLV